MREELALDKIWQKVLATLAVPGAVLAALLASLTMMEAGVAPAQTVFPIAGICLLFVALLERVLPWHRDWLQFRGDLRVDALYLPVQLGMGALFRPLVAALAVAGGGWLSELSPGGIWPGSWPIAASP